MHEPEALPTVLVVDDEEEVLELLGEYLRIRGHALRTAYDGQSALELIRAGGIDVVLSDVSMPHMGGLELIHETQALPNPVAVILMSGFATVEAVISALQAGAFDFLRKPFRLRDVHAVVERAYGRLREEREDRRRAELLTFYEQAHGIVDADGLPRLFGTLAAVARSETNAEEVALWLVGGNGWDAVARGGVVRALQRVDVAGVTDQMVLDADDGVLAIPLALAGRRIGALAVAGGRERTADHHARLTRLGRAVTDTLTRLDWRPDR